MFCLKKSNKLGTLRIFQAKQSIIFITQGFLFLRSKIDHITLFALFLAAYNI